MKLAIELDETDPAFAGILDVIAKRVADHLATANASGDGASPRKLLWSEAEAAAALSISPLTLKKWRERGYVKSHTATRPILYTWQQIKAVAEWMPGRRRD